MIVSLQNTPFALLMQGLRLRPSSTRVAKAAPGTKAPKPAIVPHWIDFLNEDPDHASN